MDSEKLVKKSLTLKQLSLGMLAYTSTSILGPLLFFLFLGYILDRVFETKPLFIIIGVIVAFVTTNIFVYKKIRTLIKEFEKISPEGEKRALEKNIEK